MISECDEYVCVQGVICVDNRYYICQEVAPETVAIWMHSTIIAFWVFPQI